MNERTEFLSKSSVSLSEILDSARSIQEKCTDHSVANVSSKNFYYNPNINGLSFLNDEGLKCVMPLTPYALQQLCGKIGVPSRYIEKCIENGMPDLAASNMNEWIDEYHKNLFIRAHESTIRGVLSDKYTTLDAPDVLDVLGDSLPDSEYAVRGSLLTPERMHLRIVQKDKMNIKGEDLFAGVAVDSSDVGRSTLLCRFFIYKQVCTNGMCITQSYGVLFQQRHIGIDKTEFYDGLVSGVQKIPQLIETVMGQIKFANKDTDGYDFAKMQEEERVSRYSRIKALTRLQDGDIEKMIDVMYNKYSVNRWGFINSLTEVAQDFTLERRLELENVAGTLLAFPFSKVA